MELMNLNNRSKVKSSNLKTQDITIMLANISSG